jgi:hypothetical protein
MAEKAGQILPEKRREITTKIWYTLTGFSDQNLPEKEEK